MTLDFSLRFLIVLGSILVPFWPPKWAPRGARELVVWLLGAVQDGLEIVLVRSFFRLATRARFLEPLGCLLGSFLGAPGVIFGHLGGSWARIGSSWALTWAFRIRFCTPRSLYSHQLVNSSAIQPMARLHFATRAGGLRAERLNPPPPEGSERD